jgi:hypothetical protein
MSLRRKEPREQNIDPSAGRLRRRPAAVTIIVILFILQMPVLFVNFALALWEIGVLGARQPWQAVQLAMRTWQGELGVFQALWLGVLLLLVSLVTYALFRLRPWAWTAAMLVLGGRLAIGIWDYFNKSPYFFTVILYLLPVVLMNLESVRVAFGERLNPPSEKATIHGTQR